MLSNNAICYEAVQVVFRNAVVGFLRDRMTKTFPADYLLRLKKPFATASEGKRPEWDSIVQNASRSRELGGTATKIKDEFDLLSVNHFLTLFTDYFDKIFSAAGQDTASPRPNKTKLLGNLKAIKDFRDPLSHPVEQEVSFREAYAITSDAHQILDCLGLREPAEELASLMDDLEAQRTAPDTDKHLVQSLPPQTTVYLEFVGRDEILQDLRAWFSEPNNKSALLAGDGGKGKSAIAYRYAVEVSKSPGDFQLVLWLSAKRRRFEAGVTVEIATPDFFDLDSALNRLLTQYGWTDDISRPVNEKRSKVIELLQNFPAFIVVDDIDSVLEDSALIGFFNGEVPYRSPSCILLPSRKDIPGNRVFTVKGFDPKEAEVFIKSRVKLWGMDPMAFQAQTIQEITVAAEGSPLYIEDLVRLAKVIDVSKAIALWRERKGDEARRYALQRELEHLSADSKSVLIAASIAADPASNALLETVLGISEDRLISALTELQTMFLFPKPKVVEGEQRYEINWNTRKLVRLVEGGSDAYKRIEDKYKAITGELPIVGRGTISALLRQAYFLMNNNRHPEAESILLNALDKYAAPDIAGFLGFLYRCWTPPRVTDARTYFEHAFRLKCKTPDTYRHWVKMEMDAKEWTHATEAARKGLTLIPAAHDLIYLRAVAKTRLGKDFAGRLQNEKAIKLWEEAKAELKQALKTPEALEIGERFQNAKTYRALVICLELLGNLKDLNQYFGIWQAEHPDDPDVESERQRLARRLGSTFHYRGTMSATTSD